MIGRRRFLFATLAALGAPAIVRAQDAQEALIDPKYRPTRVSISARYGKGQLLVLPRAHFLYYVTGPREAIRYGVGVGRAGLEFQGSAVIGAKRKWPTWRPTDEMIEREPKTFARFKGNDYVQPGGPENPLGARALYLFKDGRDTYYRIHGTNAPRTIGLSVSNGCIRMLNAHVKDLYERVPTGTRVTVL